MKRLISALILMFVLVTAFAQQDNRHLKFMGIPITGTVNQFQAKLAAKGCTVDKSTSATLPVGVRMMKGTFAGNKADIFIYYDTQTKIVYRTKAVMGGNTKDVADQKYDDLKSLLTRKYGENSMETGTKDEHEATTFFSLKPNALGTSDVQYGEISDTAYGRIDLYVTKDEEEWIRHPYNYNVHIDYEDALNSNKHDNQKLEDL